MKGLILNNAFYCLPHYLNQSERLKAEFDLLGVETDIRETDFCGATVLNDSLSCVIDGYDFCVYLDKDKYVSEILEKSGMRLFNSHSAIRVCDDKTRTYIALAGCGVPLPDTIPGLLCFDEKAVVKQETLERVEETLGYPVVIKTSYGSLGKGVFKADNGNELFALAEEVKLMPHLFQKYIYSPDGDARVIVIGGKTFAAMRRIPDGDFRSNIELGGRAEVYFPDESIKHICEKSAVTLGLDYCGVDVLFGKHGEPYVCEVNSNAFFGGIERVTGLNVAKAYAEHIIDNIKPSI